MVLVGDLGEWHQQFRSLESRLIEAIEVAWPACISPLQTLKASMTHENHITNHLINALIRSRKVPGRIIPQYSLLTESKEKLVTLSSAIDFVVTIGDAEEIYLACEAKRLNVPYKKRTRSLAYEYVRDGLMRFVTGQYSNGLPLAVMLGYVMNADDSLAHQRVKRAMARSKTLNLKSTTDLPPAGGKFIRFFTAHDCAPGHQIQVNHTLLCWP